MKKAKKLKRAKMLQKRAKMRKFSLNFELKLLNEE